MLSPEHIALADIVRSRSRKAHYMAASSPGRMGIIRGIAAIAGDYADTLPNGQRDAFLAACGHAAATVRGEYDRAPSFIAHKARSSDPGPLPPDTCCVAGCALPRKGERIFCGPHLVEHYANMDKALALDALALDALAPDVPVPDVLVPDVLVPDVLVLDVLALDVLAPDVLAPDVLVLDVLAPDVLAPDVPVLDVPVLDVLALDVPVLDVPVLDVLALDGEMLNRDPLLEEFPRDV